MPVQRAEGDLVEVDEAQPVDAGPGERRGAVRADAAAADDDDEGGAQPAEPFGGEEDAVARELLEDQLVVEGAGEGALREEGVAGVFFVGVCEGGDVVEADGRLFSARLASRRCVGGPAGG